MKSRASKKPSAKKMKPAKEITFDANLLLESLRDHADALERGAVTPSDRKRGDGKRQRR